jgi:hypothetical protein
VKETLEVLDHVQLNYNEDASQILSIIMASIDAWLGVWHIISGLAISSIWAKKRVPQTT